MEDSLCVCVCVCVCVYLGDVIDGGLHSAQLGRLNVQQLQHVVG